MAGHERRDDRARQKAREALVSLGQDIRRARLDHDLSQAIAAAAIGKSASAWSRLERGAAPFLPIVDMARAAAVVGLDLSVRAYPGGHPLRDEAHVTLLARLRAAIGEKADWRSEVALPHSGDLRAWDAMILLPHTRVGVEAETRARDSQELQRRLALKRRDGGVDHVILLLSDTRHNRAFLRAADDSFMQDFPVPGPVALRRLAAGKDPGGSTIILL